MNKIFYDYIVNKTVGGNMAGVMQKAPNFGPRLKFLTNETEGIYKFMPVRLFNSLLQTNLHLTIFLLISTYFIIIYISYKMYYKKTKIKISKYSKKRSKKRSVLKSILTISICKLFIILVFYIFFRDYKTKRHQNIFWTPIKCNIVKSITPLIKPAW